jgi:hypothetical protein
VAPDGRSKASDAQTHPTTIGGRLALLPEKVRERGLPWLLRRILEELPRIAHRFVATPRDLAVRKLLSLHPFVSATQRATLFGIYDLQIYPISYDICWFLIWADLEREKRGLSTLQCVFVPVSVAADREYPPGYAETVDEVSRDWRFKNICVPAVQLVPSRVTVTICDNRKQLDALKLMMHHQTPNGPFDISWATLPRIYRETTRALSNARRPWGLKAEPQGLRYVQQWLRHVAKNRKPVVITLRQYQVDPQRNSRIEDWARFAREIDQVRFCPIIVPDTDHALEPRIEFGSVPVFEEAAWNVGLRMALYESAYLNMFVNCGPGSLCILNSECKYLFFKVRVDGVSLASSPTLRSMGFEEGETPPFATSCQRWIWEDDTLEVLHREFAGMVNKIEQQYGTR